jgi:hypothetical protein
MADQPPTHRFQFRLRTLMIGVTLLAGACAYFVHEANVAQEIARQRMAILVHIQIERRILTTVSLDKDMNVKWASWLRGFFHDPSIKSFLLPRDASKEERERLKSAFPEAKLVYQSHEGYWVAFPDE